MSDLKGFNQYHNEEEEVLEDSSSFLNIIDHDKLKDLVKESTVTVPIIEEVKDTNPFNGFPGPPGEKGPTGGMSEEQKQLFKDLLDIMVRKGLITAEEQIELQSHLY